MKVQADLFERSVRTMRKPSKAVKPLLNVTSRNDAVERARELGLQ
jgi:post-segregation antitoxin (ccd killing protein)